MANSNNLWDELCIVKFGIKPSELRPCPNETRILYIICYLRMKEAFYGTGTGRTAIGGGGGGGETNNVISGALFRRFNAMQQQQ